MSRDSYSYIRMNTRITLYANTLGCGHLVHLIQPSQSLFSFTTLAAN